jgi:hypothetical protein
MRRVRPVTRNNEAKKVPDAFFEKLRQNSVDDLAVDVGQAEIAALEAVGEFCVFQA